MSIRHDLTLLALIGLPIASLCLGLSPLPLWTALIGPVLEMAWWLGAKITDRPNDMEHAYIAFGLMFGVACLVAWVSGRTLRWLVVGR